MGTDGVEISATDFGLYTSSAREIFRMLETAVLKQAEMVEATGLGSYAGYHVAHEEGIEEGDPPILNVTFSFNTAEYVGDLAQ